MSLSLKLAQVMGEVSRIPKSGMNPHFQYKFVQESDVTDFIREKLAAHGVAFLASMTQVEQQTWEWETNNNGKIARRFKTKTRATFEYTFICSETGETRTCLWTGEADDEQDKGINKAATAALKYFLLKTFMISTGDLADDPDASGENGQSAQRKAQPRTTPQQAQAARQALRQADPTPAAGEGKQPPTPEPPPAKVERPYSADVLITKLQEMATKSKAQTLDIAAHDKSAQDYAIFSQNHMGDPLRYWLHTKTWGVKSSKQLTDQQIDALRKWLNGDPELVEKEVSALKRLMDSETAPAPSADAAFAALG